MHVVCIYHAISNPAKTKHISDLMMMIIMLMIIMKIITAIIMIMMMTRIAWLMPI